jgi:exopolysaccharide production protein ExoQ
MIRKWHHFATAFIIAQSLQAFGIIDRDLWGEWSGKGGDKLTQSLNLMMIAVSLALYCRGRKRLSSIRSGATLTLGLAVFLLSSIIWSINPAGTLTQGVVYLAVAIGAIGIATNLDIDEFMKLLATVCGLAALSSLLLMVAAPSQVFTSEGDYRGIFSQKNILGEAMMVGALASLHGLRATSRQRLCNGAILALVMIACILSKSTTSLSTILVFCGCHAFSALIRKRGIARIMAILMMIIAGPLLILVIVFPDPVLEIMGKDPTLTGRTEIWSYVIPDIFQRPFLGWGYNAFWSVTNPAAAEIDDAVHWVVPQAHNGLLEILLHVGVAGAAFFLFLLARNINLALRCLRTSDKALALSALLCCASIILVGISEIVLLNGLEASTPVFFVTGLYCERALWLRQRRSAASRHGFADRYAMPRPMAGSRLRDHQGSRIGPRSSSALVKAS